MKRDLRRTAGEVAAALSAIAEHILDGDGLNPRAQRLVAESLHLQASILRSAVRSASMAPANAERAQEADARARKAIEAIRARGQSPTVRAVAAEARCSMSTAHRALRAIQAGGNTPEEAQALRGKESAQGA